MKKLIGMVAVALAMTLASGAASAADKLKVGFIYVGPIGDHGWTYAHDQGRLALEGELGDMVETVYVESVPEGADAERAIERLARQGAGLIFTTSFGYMNPTIKVAERFPDVKFEHATGYKSPTTSRPTTRASMKAAMSSARSPRGRRSRGLPAISRPSPFPRS